MLFTLFTVATFGLWLWILPVLAFFTIFTLIAWDNYRDPNYGLSAIIIMLTALFFIAFTDVPIWAFILNSWKTIALIVGVWVGFGAVWTLPRWWFFYLPERVEDYEKNKDRWSKEYASSYDKDRFADLKEWLLAYKDVPPSPIKNKARIITWMWFSFCDFLYCILHKAVRRFFNWVFSLFQGMYSAMSKRAFAHFDELK